MKQLCLAAALALALSLASHAAPERPRLIVFLAVDGLPMRQVEAWKDRFGPDGFRRFLEQGSTWTQARYLHAHTVTGVGHASMLTGATPAIHGIISNDWTDPQTRQGLYCAEDRRYRYLGVPRTAPDAGTSPANLLAETVGDVLRKREPQAKVIGISGKDRGAILPAGHRGTAYMFLTENGFFSSSSYYMEQHPAWVNAFNARRPADTLWGATWSPLLAEDAYAGYAPDNSPWMASAGFGRSLPVQLGKGQEDKGPRFYGDLLTSPFGDQLTLDFARAAVAGEQLGQDRTPDILAVSLSSHDYISHAFGPESRLVQDHLLQLDRLLQVFFRDLDARVGKGRYAVMLTADHGFTDTPEWAKQQGRRSGRLPVAQLMGLLNASLQEQFGAPRLARTISAGGILFDEALMREQNLDAATVYRAAAKALRSIEGVGAAYGPEDLRSLDAPRADQPLLQTLRHAWHPTRSAPVLFGMAEGWILGSRLVGATHGNPWPSDQHVPILAWGPHWFPKARIDTPVAVTDIAPTLSILLNQPAPAQSIGRPLAKR
jgi:hypothetical protein